MAFEQRNNSGALFANRKRETEKHPNATGDALIGGVKYRVSAWTKTDKNGNKWQSLSFSPVDASDRDRTSNSNPVADIESDLPY